MYVHKNCAPAGAELDMEKRVGGFCAFCNQAGTIYQVKGTPDYYEAVVDSVLYKYVNGKQFNTRAAVRARLRVELSEARATRAMDAHNERVPVWLQVEENETFRRDESIEEAESIPMRKITDIEKLDTMILEISKSEVQSEDAEVSEEVVPAEPPTDGESEAEEVPEENVTMTAEEQIASLQAQIEDLKAKEAEEE